jgi:cyanophycinase
MLASVRAGAVAALLAVGVAHAGPYEYFLTEHADVRPGPRHGGLLLLGGGDWPEESMPWFAEHAGFGHVVMIGASGDAEDHAELAEALGRVASLETLVLHDRASSSDPRVLAVLARADAIFIHGGDQANYVRFWKGTPLAKAIERRFREGCPVGGTSAGLAILGEWAYGAMDGGSLSSEDALRDPLGPAVTLVGNFLHLPPLAGVITDSHFAPRGRLGRLMVFVARLGAEGHPVTGLGIDEEAGVLIERDGSGRVVSRNGGGVTIVGPPHPATLAANAPLLGSAFTLTRIDAGGQLALGPLRPVSGSRTATISVDNNGAPPSWP